MIVNLHFDDGNLDFKSFAEALRYKRAHPNWQGIQFLDDKRVTTNKD